MAAKKGDKVKVEYEGKLDDGSVFDSSKTHGHPLEFEVGAQMVIPGFDQAIEGMNVGDEKDVKIDAKDAYGEPNSELVKSVPKDKIPAEALKEGAVLGMTLPNGQQIPAVVKEIGENEVKIDLNHPLAGKNLNFHIKLVEIA